MSSLDSTGQNSFSSGEWSDQQTGIGQTAPFACENAYGPVRGRKSKNQLFIPCNRRRERARHKGTVAARAVHYLAEWPQFAIDCG